MIEIYLLEQDREIVRVAIPILDDEAYVQYDLACKPGDKKRFALLFKRLSE